MSCATASCRIATASTTRCRAISTSGFCTPASRSAVFRSIGLTSGFRTDRDRGGEGGTAEPRTAG